MSLHNLLTASVCVFILALSGCSGDSPTEFDSLDVSPSANADARSSYSYSKTDIRVDYLSLPRPQGTGNLSDAVAYLDADGDGDTDIFMATGEFLLDGEVNSILALNSGNGQFVSSTAEFGGSMPPATHARKSIVSDFNNDNLLDIFVFDHGFDSHPFPGSVPKLIIQQETGVFTWSRLNENKGFHHGGAAADVDNDGDVDIFVGGFEPFFYINDGNANFTRNDDRFGGSISKVFTAELIDVDKDGYVDLLVGSAERDGDITTVYWGNSSGQYRNDMQFEIPSVPMFGAVLDFDVEDVDGDGNRDIVVNRTRDGDDGPGRGFYQGRRLQLLFGQGSRSFSEATNTSIDYPGGDNDLWFPWVRMEDFDNDGDVDILPDDMAHSFTYVNDGEGQFTFSQ